MCGGAIERTHVPIRVNRGDWLGKPANFKEPNKRTCSDVQRTSHLTLTVHNKPRWRLEWRSYFFLVKNLRRF